MKIIILLSLFLVVIHAVSQRFNITNELNDEWEYYKIKFGKKYESLNEITRRMIWEKNLKYIQQHNLEYDLGKHSYTLGLNTFTDMTNEEFKSKFTRIISTRRNVTGTQFMNPENLSELPKRIDWREKGYVTPVQNQNPCGSCWAFSAIGSLEGQHFRKTGKLISFSEQQIVDCNGYDGCRGGHPISAFDYIEKYGIEAEKVYPYTANYGECLYDKSNIAGTCTGYVQIESGNENSLAIAVATIGPISIGIAVNEDFQHYESGIYNDPNCNKYDMSHAVLVVGYGSENNQNYWLVKNSWGTDWGNSGYIKMSKDLDNQCFIATDASYPLV